MSEMTDDRKIFSLLEVTESIERTLSRRYTSTFWVKAELLRLNHYPRSGHCYPDLVEKSGKKVVAQIRSYLWKNDFEGVNERFISVTGDGLKDGINILFQARIRFDPVYGLALQILDIDPQYTLGDMLREKMATIDRLVKEGLFDRNRKLPFPLLPKRIAVISVETSKGYSDFLSKIEGNLFGYRFFHMLFPSLLQGDKAVAEIRQQLKRIGRVKKHFDVVAIIRGGGGDVGLNCYDNYHLARDIALFPLPVLTGIGHSTNETVAQMVAYRNNITPTDVADFLIQCFHNFAVPLLDLRDEVAELSSDLLREEKFKLLEIVHAMDSKAHKFISAERTLLEKSMGVIRHRSASFIDIGKEKTAAFSRTIIKAPFVRLGMFRQNLSSIKASFTRDIRITHEKNLLVLREMEEKTRILDPENTLKRGFSLTYLNGKVLSDISEVSIGNEIITLLANGSIKSKVKSKHKGYEK